MLIKSLIEIPSIRGVFEYFRNKPLVVKTIILSMRKAGVYLETEKMEYRRGNDGGQTFPHPIATKHSLPSLSAVLLYSYGHEKP